MAIETLKVAGRVDPLLSHIDVRLEAMKWEILYRWLQMLVGWVVINIVVGLGVMFALVKLLGH